MSRTKLLTFAPDKLSGFDVIETKINMIKSNTERSIVHVEFGSLRIEMSNQWECSTNHKLFNSRTISISINCHSKELKMGKVSVLKLILLTEANRRVSGPGGSLIPNDGHLQVSRTLIGDVVFGTV